MDFETTLSGRLTQPATLAPEPSSEKATALFPPLVAVVVVALLASLYMVFGH